MSAAEPLAPLNEEGPSPSQTQQGAIPFVGRKRRVQRDPRGSAIGPSCVLAFVRHSLGWSLETSTPRMRYRTLSIITTTIFALALIVFVAFLLALKAVLVILLVVALVVALLWALARRSG